MGLFDTMRNVAEVAGEKIKNSAEKAIQSANEKANEKIEKEGEGAKLTIGERFAKFADGSLASFVEDVKEATASIKVRDNYKSIIINANSEEALKNAIRQFENAPLNEKDKETLRRVVRDRFLLCQSHGKIRSDAITPFMDGVTQEEADKYFKELEIEEEQKREKAEKRKAERAAKKAEKEAALEAQKVKEEAEKKAIEEKINSVLTPKNSQEEKYIKENIGCEKGYCADTGFGFYYNCPKDIACPKKKENLAKIKQLNNPEVMPYIIDFAIAKALYNGEEEKRVKMQFIAEQFPYFNGHPLIQNNIYNCLRFGDFDFVENKRLGILKTVHDVFQREKLNFTAENDSNVLEILAGNEEIVFENGNKTWAYGTYIGEYHPFFRDVTLFTREYKDFIYSLMAISHLCRIRCLRETMHLEGKTGIEEDILFDKNGRLKEAGVGGELVGEIGDTIWNTINSLSKYINTATIIKHSDSIESMEEAMENFEENVVAVIKESVNSIDSINKHKPYTAENSLFEDFEIVY